MTAKVVWKAFYSVGDSSLDAEHSQVIEVINDLYAAMDEGEDYAAVKPLLDRLVRYTNEHFRDEERVMQEHDYPGFAEHKALHDRMRKRTADLRAFADLVTGRDLLNFLKEWWLGHIQSKDKEYAPYLQVQADPPKI